MDTLWQNHAITTEVIIHSFNELVNYQEHSEIDSKYNIFFALIFAAMRSISNLLIYGKLPAKIHGYFNKENTIMKEQIKTINDEGVITFQQFQTLLANTEKKNQSAIGLFLNIWELSFMQLDVSFFSSLLQRVIDLNEHIDFQSIDNCLELFKDFVQIQILLANNNKKDVTNMLYTNWENLKDHKDESLQDTIEKGLFEYKSDGEKKILNLVAKNEKRPTKENRVNLIFPVLLVIHFYGLDENNTKLLDSYKPRLTSNTTTVTYEPILYFGYEQKEISVKPFEKDTFDFKIKQGKKEIILIYSLSS